MACLCNCELLILNCELKTKNLKLKIIAVFPGAVEETGIDFFPPLG
jgi:hypothetical protein